MKKKPRPREIIYGVTDKQYRKLARQKQRALLDDHQAETEENNDYRYNSGNNCHQYDNDDDNFMTDK